VTELPSGWAWASLGEVSEKLQYGWTTKADPHGTTLKLLRTTDITHGAIDWAHVPACTTTPPDPAKYLLAPDDIVVSRAGSVGASARIREAPPAVFASYLIRVRPKGVEPAYVDWFLKSPYYWRQIEDAAAGIALQNVNAKKLSALQVPIAPQAEQRRIVVVIEEQLSRLDAATAALTAGLSKLRRLHTAVIEATFDPLWPHRPFGEVARVAGDLVDPAVTPDAPHIAPNHIESGTGRLLPYRTIREDGVTSGKNRFHAGQILYSKIRPYLKKAVLVDFDGLCSADMYPIVTDLEPRFLLWWMLTERFTETAIAQQGRSVLPKINREALARLPVPTPGPDDQRRAVEAVESQLSIIEQLRERLMDANTRSDALRRAVLATAFRGELIPQNLDDEPASILLERISGDCAAAPKQERKRRKKMTA
jgi:type I restriction enzyme S subunit